MAERITALPDILPADELRREQAYLWAYPRLIEANIRTNTTERDLTSEERSKLFDLDNKREERKNLREMLVFDIKDDSGYRMSVFKPDGEKDLVKKLSSVGTCWSGNYEERSAELIEDLKIGGSVVLFGEKKMKGGNYKPKVFSRSNICIDTHNRSFLFVDTIENGNTGASSIRSWDKRKKELTLVTLGWMHIARHLGFDTIGLGEEELQELGRNLGAQTKKLFKKYEGSGRVLAHKRKIGREIYCWKLHRNSDGRFYAFDLDLALDLSKKMRAAHDRARKYNDYVKALDEARSALDAVNRRYRRGDV